MRRLAVGLLVGVALGLLVSAEAGQSSGPAPIETALRAQLRTERAEAGRLGARYRHEIRRARAALAAAHRALRAAGALVPPHLRSIAACESGGRPDAVSPGGTYRGAYQFDRATWAGVGGTGDPASASIAEQTYRAELLYARRGAAPWPVCGR